MTLEITDAGQVIGAWTLKVILKAGEEVARKTGLVTGENPSRMDWSVGFRGLGVYGCMWVLLATSPCPKALLKPQNTHYEAPDNSTALQQPSIGA